MTVPARSELTPPTPRPRSGRRLNQATPVMHREEPVAVKLREPAVAWCGPAAATSADRDVLVIHSGDRDDATPAALPRSRTRRRVRTPTQPLHAHVERP